MEKAQLFYDNTCGMCNYWAGLVSKIAKGKAVTLHPQTSNRAQSCIIEHNKESVDSVFLLWKGKLYQKSEAILLCLRLIGFPYSILYAAVIIPQSIRDWVYDFVARNRIQKKAENSNY